MRRTTGLLSATINVLRALVLCQPGPSWLRIQLWIAQHLHPFIVALNGVGCGLSAVIHPQPFMYNTRTNAVGSQSRPATVEGTQAGTYSTLDQYMTHIGPGSFDCTG